MGSSLIITKNQMSAISEKKGPIADIFYIGSLLMFCVTFRTFAGK